MGDESTLGTPPRECETPPPPLPELPAPLPAVAGTGLASILIPCCGQLEYTKLCIPSVLRYSREPFELICLDIGSLDGTAEYLAGVAATVLCGTAGANAPSPSKSFNPPSTI